MKLFSEMTPKEKIDHIQQCMDAVHTEACYTTDSADLLDVWDYWVPYLIKRLKQCEKVVEEAENFVINSYDGDNDTYSLTQALIDAGSTKV